MLRLTIQFVDVRFWLEIYVKSGICEAKDLPQTKISGDILIYLCALLSK